MILELGLMVAIVTKTDDGIRLGHDGPEGLYVNFADRSSQPDLVKAMSGGVWAARHAGRRRRRRSAGDEALC
ncbi:hypothetical protein [Streptomyces siamensis]|uniref:Uncharacterized protein n=1 Tax=Streptomyces siamensis TaxID=1274986 RepID=A0ABP9JIA6_9ACTN